MKLLFERWNQFLKEDDDTKATKEDILKWTAAHFPEYGNPRHSREALEKMSVDLGYEGIKQFANDKAIRRLFLETSADIYNNYNLPKQKEGTVRINHTTGLRVNSTEERYEIIDNILTNGLVNQAKGTGRYSESPMDIFGVIDNPGAGERNVYNKNFPWFTLDVPEDQHGLQRAKPGSVVVLTREVPERYIIGVCGISKYDYLKAVIEYKAKANYETNT